MVQGPIFIANDFNADYKLILETRISNLLKINLVKLIDWWICFSDRV